MRMHPKQLVVEHGGSQVINCSTTCPKPHTGGVETSLNKTLLVDEAQWKQYEVFDISQDTVVYCHFTCSKRQASVYSNISVFCECSTLPRRGQPSPGQTPHLPSGPTPGHSRHGPHLPGLLRRQSQT